MFRDPFVKSAAENATEVNEGGRKIAFLHKTFFGKTGKSIDEAKCECSLGNLSPSGEWFFEIYFVRLIGTPNHHIPS